MQSPLTFQYCQKLIILSADKTSVLLARRKDEADYNGVFSFIGGKMETSDESLVAGMKREKGEEIGAASVVKLWPHESYNILFRKKDGASMVLPHIAGYFVSGDVVLNEEYSEYQWVPLQDLADFEPKIDNVPQMTFWARRKLQEIADKDLVTI